MCCAIECLGGLGCSKVGDLYYMLCEVCILETLYLVRCAKKNLPVCTQLNHNKAPSGLFLLMRYRGRDGRGRKRCMWTCASVWVKLKLMPANMELHAAQKDDRTNCDTYIPCAGRTVAGDQRVWRGAARLPGRPKAATGRRCARLRAGQLPRLFVRTRRAPALCARLPLRLDPTCVTGLYVHMIYVNIYLASGLRLNL